MSRIFRDCSGSATAKSLLRVTASAATGSAGRNLLAPAAAVNIWVSADLSHSSKWRHRPAVVCVCVCVCDFVCVCVCVWWWACVGADALSPSDQRSSLTSTRATSKRHCISGVRHPNCHQWVNHSRGQRGRTPRWTALSDNE